MKRYIVFTVLALSVFNVLAQEVSKDDELKATNPYIRIEPTEVNLGKIPTNKVTEDLGNVEVSIHNDGAKPLILNQVTACCGTRVVEWTREPIPPQGKGKVKVSFREGTHPHRISRSITITSNAANGSIQRVSISGEIVVPSEVKEIKLGHSREMD